MGSDAILVGCMPTPAVAYLTRFSKAGAGIVISASHNPYHDNGIKVFGPNGYKLSVEAESELEMSLFEKDWERMCSDIRAPGTLQFPEENEERYLSFLENSIPDDFSLDGMRLVLDCANGATHSVAPALFEKLGANVDVLFSEPDGININDGCGSQHTDSLSKKVVESGADLGLAFDGDGDRLIAVDETGETLTGDQVIVLLAKRLLERGELKKNQVVTTVMSNIGLKRSLDSMNITHLECGVGDRLVLEKMISTGSVLGGEDSGHIILLDHHTTGDGLLAAIQLVLAMKETSLPLSEMKTVMTLYPQVLTNVRVAKKPNLKTIHDLQQAISNTEADLGENGRVLVRYSGTEPICRVMVEGPTVQETEDHCKKISDAVKESIGVKDIIL
jgi:phosphoglucosamine mutase